METIDELHSEIMRLQCELGKMTLNSNLHAERHENAEIELCNLRKDVSEREAAENLAYGLLWMDRATEARKVMLDRVLKGDKKRQTAGIECAKAIHQQLARDKAYPRPVAMALKMLEEAEKLSAYGCHDEDEEDIACIKFRAARFGLENWAIGMEGGGQ